jgi:CRISPR system Cascade subunit CasC
MFIELHILQNFAPSNLNRDETGAPKSCQFGDVPRARVSSQALKRAARDYVKDKELLDPQILGRRSLLTVEKLKEILMKEFGKDENQAAYVAKDVLEKANWKKADDKTESEALQFLGGKSLRDIAALCNESWDLFQETILLNEEKQNLKNEKKALESKIRSLEKDINKNPTKELQDELDGKNSELEINRKNQEQNDASIKEADKKLSALISNIKKILGAKQTPDIAMFGRMMANAPEFGIDAASQVAHAISTHAVANGDFDYFTAIDEFKKELNPNADAGAAMIGTVDFNSACYYRYANIDTECLKDNLKNADNPADLARETVKAFLQSFVIAVPSGKQNSFASPTLPTLILGVVREGYLCSLANAFSKPISLKDDGKGLIENSIEQMTKHFCNQERMYGRTVGTKYGTFCCESPEFVVMPKQNDNGGGEVSRNHKAKFEESDSLENLIDNLTDQAFDQSNGE